MAPSKRSGGKRSPHARYTAAGTDGIGRLELTRPEKLNATDDDSVGDPSVASTEATFGLSAVRHGIIPGLATYRLARHIGLGPAREMMLLGETWDAARAERQGLVNRVVPVGQLDAAALDLAARLAANVRAASVATKRLTLRSYDLPFRRFLEEYVRAQRGCWDDRETRQNLSRYRSGGWAK